MESRVIMPPGSPVLQVHNVSKRFGATQALDDVTLELRAGEVHALLGENGAGKSTLVNVLSGELTPDGGNILSRCKPVRFNGPWDATARGISVVHQELAVCPNLTVAQNIGLQLAARQPVWSAVADPRATARRLFEELGATHVPLDAPVRRLSVGQRQVVEIAKALAIRTDVLILDEPNSALTGEESSFLFRVVGRLRTNGVAIVYVSHRLEEVMALADRITVMRDGRVVETGPRSAFTIPDLIRRMVGREVDHLFRRVPLAPPRAEVALETLNLTSGRDVHNVSLRVREGEIYGLAGLPGSGKDELVACLAGLQRFQGELRVGNRSVRVRSPLDVIREGMAIVPADRRESGIFPVLSIIDNVAAANLRKTSRFGFRRTKATRQFVQRALETMRVKAHSFAQAVGTLSGGNQQKVVLGRSVAGQPRVLLVHEPTRGIDVSAKAEIYAILNRLAAEGMAVIIASVELPELMGQCDRLAVFHGGALAKEFGRTEYNEVQILACAMGQTVVPVPERLHA